MRNDNPLKVLIPCMVKMMDDTSNGDPLAEEKAFDEAKKVITENNMIEELQERYK